MEFKNNESIDAFLERKIESIPQSKSVPQIGGNNSSVH